MLSLQGEFFLLISITRDSSPRRAVTKGKKEGDKSISLAAFGLIGMGPDILEHVNDRALLADGGIGTELQRVGLEPGACAEVWNVEHPEKVRAIHHAYVDAGAQLITTNSFRGNRFALSSYGLESQVARLNRRAAEIAREATKGRALVMGSIGPLGSSLEPLGEISSQDAFNWFVEQAQALLEGGVDVIIIETMTAAEELELAVRAARQVGASTIFATMAFNKVKDGYRTMMGVAPEQAIEAMARAGADVIGLNCGAHMAVEDCARIVKQFRACCNKPIIAQPNAGQPELVGSEIVYRQTPEAMAAEIGLLVPAGASIIGGCCGTTPEHIRLFGERLKINL